MGAKTSQWLEFRRSDSRKNNRPLWKHSLWADAKELSEIFPETFHRPAEKELEAIAVGDFVKICFMWDSTDPENDAMAMDIANRKSHAYMEEAGSEIMLCNDDEQWMHGERFWVLVEEVSGETMTGSIANPLVYISAKDVLGAERDDLISLKKDNVYDIMTYAEVERFKNFNDERRGLLNVHQHEMALVVDAVKKDAGENH